MNSMSVWLNFEQKLFNESWKWDASKKEINQIEILWAGYCLSGGKLKPQTRFVLPIIQDNHFQRLIIQQTWLIEIKPRYSPGFIVSFHANWYFS